MKAVIRFLLVFLSGIVVGYLLAQEPVRAKLKVVLGDAWTSIREQTAKWMNRTENGEKPPPSTVSNVPPPPPMPVQPSAADRNAYIRQSIVMLDILAKSDPGSPQTAIVTGTIKNNGNRSLNHVEASFYFIDKDNIFFEARVPILTGNLLPAGQSQNFSVRVAGIPPPGVKSKIRASIIDVGFGD